MSPSLVIDGGGSTVRARLHGPGNSTVELREPVNVVSVRQSDVADRLGRLLDRLPSGAPTPDLVIAGLAGAATAERSRPVAAWLRQRFPASSVRVVRDIDLVSTQLDGPGAALIVGTGAVALVPTADSEVLVDGLGFPVGDWGGGAWIGLEALRRALRHFDLTGTASSLLEALCAELDLPTDRGVSEALRADGVITPQHVARLAPPVLRLAGRGDPDATAVIDAAVAALRETVLAALHRAGIHADAQLVAAGGLTEPGLFRQRLTRSLTTAGVVTELRFVNPLDAEQPAN